MNTSYKNLIIISIPAIFSVAMEPLAEIIDIALVGRLNSQWLAAMGISSSILATATALFNFLVYTVTARIANAVGDGNKSLVGSQIKLAVYVALTASLILSICMYLSRGYLLETIMDTKGDTLKSALTYYELRIFSIPLVLLSTAFVGILRGLQKISASMVLIGIITLSNFLISYTLMYQMNWGIEGAATGTIISFLLGCLYGVYYLGVNKDACGIPHSPKPSIRDVFDFGKEALNLMMRTACLLLVFFASTTISSRMGTETVAAHSIALRIWILGAFIMDGYAVTATAFGGKLLGQKKLDTWKLMNGRLIKLSFIMGCTLALILFFGQSSIIGIFTRDPVLVEIIAGYFFIIVIAQPLNAIVFVYDGILFGNRSHRFLKTSMFISISVGGLPFFVAAQILKDPIYIQLGLLGTNAIRLVTGWVYLRKSAF